MKPWGYITVFLGVVALAAPHHLLPTRTALTGTGAFLKIYCYSWLYHPEFYLGIVLVILGVLLLLDRFRRPLSLTVIFIGLLLFVTAYMMKPPEYYLKIGANLLNVEYNPYIWQGENSIRAHIGIRHLLFLLGLATVATGYLSYIDREVTLVKKRYTTSYISLQNIKEKPFRNAVLVFMVSVAASSLFAGTIIIKGSEGGLESATGRLGADIAVVPEEVGKVGQKIILGTRYKPVYMDEKLVQEVARVPGVERVTPQLYVGFYEFEEWGMPYEAGVVGFDPHTDFIVQPWLWTSQYGIKGVEVGPMEAIVGKAVPYLRGQKIGFLGGKFTVVGTLKWTGIGFFDYAVFIRMDDAFQVFSDLPKDTVSVIYVKLEPGRDVSQVAREIEEIPNISALPVQKSTTMVREKLVPLSKAFFLFCSVLWVFAISAISILFSMTVNERKRELGVLRAMGASRNFVIVLFAKETAFIGILGGIIGTVMGGTVVIAFKNAIIASLKIPFIWPSSLFIVALFIGTLVLSTVICALGAIIPTRKSIGMEPYELIRGGE